MGLRLRHSSQSLQYNIPSGGQVKNASQRANFDVNAAYPSGI
jgi:hypothetical protein